MTQPSWLRLFFSYFLVAAGVAAGLGGLFIVVILTWGGWPAEHYGAIIAILGRLATGAGLLMTLVVVFIGLGGPVKSAKMGLAKLLNLETESD